MGNELRPQKPSLSLQPARSLSRSYNNYNYTSDCTLSSLTPQEPSPSQSVGNNNNNNNNNHKQFQFTKPTLNDSNDNALRRNIKENVSKLPNLHSNNTLSINLNGGPLTLQSTYSNSSTYNHNGDHSIIPKITPKSLSRTDSFSYSQRLGIAADQLPQTMMDDDEIINKNQGRKSISDTKKKKKHIFKFNKIKSTKNGHSNSSNTNTSTLTNTRSLSLTPTATISTASRRRSVINSKIVNGITGKYISEKIANRAALFWVQNIDVLQRKNQLEIGCLLFFSLIEKHPEVNKFFKKDKIEETALRFFDMFGWLIRSLTLNGVNLWRVLSKIGEQHNKMDIKVNHYHLLLEAFHYAMSESFVSTYTIEVKYCIDQIFTIATCIMTGHNYDQLSFGGRVLELNDCRFLKKLEICLSNPIGREYLYRYLGQTYCSEIVIFIQLYQEYNDIDGDKHEQKLLKAKGIADISLSRDSEFPINVSYAASTEFWSRLKKCESEFESDADTFNIDPLLFDIIWDEVNKLILNNHWGSFVSTVRKISNMQNSVIV